MKIDISLRNRLKEYTKRTLEKEMKGKVTIVTPYKLTDEVRQRFYQIFPELREKTVENKIDPRILGGFVIYDNAMILDASIEGKIKSLADKIYESSK